MTTGLATDIATPDRRVRVFVSSTLEELAPERRAARAAITRLRLTPVMFELGARPHPPRELYRSYLAQSDVFIGIYGERYGWTAPDMEISGLEDEYLLSGDRPKLMYVRTPAPAREPRLTSMIERIWGDGTASTTPYRDAEELGERIADDLALLLTDRFAAATRPGPAAAAVHPAPLPVPLTPLVGRERELRELLSLLRRPEARLVTITGPGGIGKTRLALEAAAVLAGELDGVTFVDLAAVADAQEVPNAVAAALGVRVEGTRPLIDVLTDRLAGWGILLVLDNFEHVLGATPDVARLLSACPRTRVLVTSRSVLRLRGEHEYPVAPLETPVLDRATIDPASVAASAAVQVFLERARQVRPGLEVTQDNAAALAEIVRRLDGIPLAIELAAARTRLMPPDLLLRRLDRRLDLHSQDVDTPARQQTLRDTIEWSYGLLAAQDRVLLGRLSVFVGGWSMSAAEAVGQVDGDLDVLETLSSLVEHSLVSPDGVFQGEPRFRMLDTVREYAAECLRSDGGYAAAMSRLAAYVTQLSQDAGAALAGPEGRDWAPRVDTELDTLRAVLRWAIDADDAELAVRVTAPLSRYWWSRGLLGEMLGFAEQAAQLPSASRLSPDSAALMLWGRGTTLIALGRTEEAAPLLAEAVDIARRIGNPRLLAQGLFSHALTLPAQERPQVRSMLEESLRLFRDLDDHWGVALALTPLGQLALLDQDVPAAVAMHEEALERAARIEDDHMRGACLDQLGFDALLTGDVPGARDRLAAAGRIHRRLQDLEGLAYCLDGFTAVTLASGRQAEAARLLGTADRVRQVAGVAVWPLLRPLADQLAAAVRAAAGASYDEEHARGAAAEPFAVLDALLDAAAAQPEPEPEPGAVRHAGAAGVPVTGG